MPTKTFDRMLRDPASHRLPIFAGQRVRMADLIVELADRGPRRIVRRTFAVLAFDDQGAIDTARFDGQQVALAESAIASVFAGAGREDMWSTRPVDLSRTEARGFRRAVWPEPSKMRQWGVCLRAN
jgi:hypothetical protein